MSHWAASDSHMIFTKASLSDGDKKAEQGATTLTTLNKCGKYTDSC